jgi:hypothetical protein
MEEALMNRDLRQEAAPAKLSMLLDQLETALPVLVGGFCRSKEIRRRRGKTNRNAYFARS